MTARCLISTHIESPSNTLLSYTPRITTSSLHRISISTFSYFSEEGADEVEAEFFFFVGEEDEEVKEDEDIDEDEEVIAGEGLLCWVGLR